MDFHHIGYRNNREFEPIRLARSGINRRRPRSPAAAAKEIRTDNKVFVRIDSLARTDHNVPPPGLAVVGTVYAGNVSIAAKGVTNQDGIVTGLVKLTIRLIGHINGSQLLATLQF